MKIEYIAGHHFGAPASSPLYQASVLKERDINALHKSRWPDFPSKLNGSFIGYNFIIWPDGSHNQYRYIGEETAAQKGYNQNTISICLAGNFTKGADQPTVAQKIKLKNMVEAILTGRFDAFNMKVLSGTIVSCDKTRIHPHRFFQKSTACYGNYLGDNWMRDLVNTTETAQLSPDTESKIAKLQKQILELRVLILQKMIELLQKQKLGIFGRNPGPAHTCFEMDVRG